MSKNTIPRPRVGLFVGPTDEPYVVLSLQDFRDLVIRAGRACEGDRMALDQALDAWLQDFEQAAESAASGEIQDLWARFLASTGGDRVPDEDAEDVALAQETRAMRLRGASEALPLEALKRILAGESPVRVWRQHRNMTQEQLAAKAQVPQPYLSQIETGKKQGSAETLKKLAHALRIDLDELVP